MSNKGLHPDSTIDRLICIVTKEKKLKKKRFFSEMDWTSLCRYVTLIQKFHRQKGCALWKPVEAADIALMTDDVSNVPYLKWLSNTTVKTIKGAITLSMCINFAAVTLSVLGILTPTTGALVHNAGSCFVVLLAALLYDRKYRRKQ